MVGEARDTKFFFFFEIVMCIKDAVMQVRVYGGIGESFGLQGVLLKTSS